MKKWIVPFLLLLALNFASIDDSDAARRHRSSGGGSRDVFVSSHMRRTPSGRLVRVRSHFRSSPGSGSSRRSSGSSGGFSSSDVSDAAVADTTAQEPAPPQRTYIAADGSVREVGTDALIEAAPADGSMTAATVEESTTTETVRRTAHPNTGGAPWLMSLSGSALAMGAWLLRRRL